MLEFLCPALLYGCKDDVPEAVRIQLLLRAHHPVEYLQMQAACSSTQIRASDGCMDVLPVLSMWTFQVALAFFAMSFTL
jgi:hypothetical protein